MKHTDRYLASLSDEGRYRLLIEAITDYAIFLLDPTGIVTTWNPGAQRFKGYSREETSVSTFRAFTQSKIRKLAYRRLRWRLRNARENSRRKAGASVRTDRIFGPTSLLIRSAIHPASSLALQRSRAT